MLNEINAMIACLRYIRQRLGTSYVMRTALDGKAGVLSAIIIEDSYRIDNDVVDGGQNTKGEDAWRGTV